MNVDYYPTWPSLVTMAGLLGLASTPLLTAADTPPSDTKSRVSSLDGLRGFLAYGVFFGHAARYHLYLQNGGWGFTTAFYDMAQTGAVALFFMITGYLFWRKLLAKNGHPDWLGLYVGRIFRIGPLYLITITGMLAVVFLRAPIGQEPLRGLAKEIASWMMLGVNYTKLDVNGYPNTHGILFGVTWTLHFEWLFYFCLAFLAVPARSKYHLQIVTIALAACLVHLVLTHRAGLKIEMFAAVFLLGMLSGSLEERHWLIGGSQTVKSAIAVVFLALFAATQAVDYAPLPAIFLGGLFYAIISGADLFGLLTSKAARRLGDVSFGIYLLQGLVVTTVFSTTWARSTALRSPAGHWSMMGGCAILLLILATLAHVYVERPGIKAGRAIARFLHRSLKAASIKTT